jgi:hypothetical protein
MACSALGEGTEASGLFDKVKNCKKMCKEGCYGVEHHKKKSTCTLYTAPIVGLDTTSPWRQHKWQSCWQKNFDECQPEKEPWNQGDAPFVDGVRYDKLGKGDCRDSDGNSLEATRKTSKTSLSKCSKLCTKDENCSGFEYDTDEEGRNCILFGGLGNGGVAKFKYRGTHRKSTCHIKILEVSTTITTTTTATATTITTTTTATTTDPSTSITPTPTTTEEETTTSTTTTTTTRLQGKSTYTKLGKGDCKDAAGNEVEVR